MLRPEDITNDTYHKVVNDLLQEQMQYSTQYILDEVGRWDETFISDDGTDYVETAIDALRTLMRLRYEGRPEDLRDFLFTSREEFGDGTQFVGTQRFLYGEPAMVIDSAEGLCPTITEILEPMYEAEENSRPPTRIVAPNWMSP